MHFHDLPLSHIDHRAFSGVQSTGSSESSSTAAMIMSLRPSGKSKTHHPSGPSRATLIGR